MYVKKHRLFASSIAFFLLLLPALALAQTGSTGIGAPTGNTGIGAPTGSTDGSSGELIQNPLKVKDFCGLLKAIFNVLVIFAIPVAVVLVVYAGFKFVLARGNPTGLSNAKTNLIWTLIGIALFFGAWFLAQVIANTLVQLGGNGNTFTTCF